MYRFLPDMPTDKYLSGKELLLVAKDFDTNRFIFAHTDAKKFCNFFKQKPKDPDKMIEIYIYIDRQWFGAITAYYGTMYYYCVGAQSFEEMVETMRRHCEDNVNNKALF